MINKLANDQSYASERNDRNDISHTNKMNSFKKKAKQKRLELD